MNSIFLVLGDANCQAQLICSIDNLGLEAVANCLNGYGLKFAALNSSAALMIPSLMVILSAFISTLRRMSL